MTRRLNSRFGQYKKRNVFLPRLILITDAIRLKNPLPVAASLPRGSAIILRHYDDFQRELLARSLIKICKLRGLRLLVANDARLAIRVGADGIHLQEALAARGPGVWRLWLKPNWIVTAAAHSPIALRRAKLAGADAALLSPVFASLSHPGSPPIGRLRFAAWCKNSSLPVYALGGITASQAAALAIRGCAGLAAIGGIMDAFKQGAALLNKT